MDTPILLLIFNRKEPVKQVLHVLRQVKPSRLYVAADGPRASKQNESELCESVRRYVLQSIDWPCEVTTHFQDQNLGCGKHVSQAITWFFQQVEEGIILEDDCIPHPDFFSYCTILLAQYRYHLNIFTIGANNFQSKPVGDGSYYFSTYGHIWGWATWRRAWRHYQYDLKQYDSASMRKALRHFFPSMQEFDYWWRLFLMMRETPVDTWDYQWSFCQWYRKGLSIMPNVNLVSNIGYGEDATHTKHFVEGILERPIHPLPNVVHPSKIARNRKVDLHSFNTSFEKRKPRYAYRKAKEKLRFELKKLMASFNGIRRIIFQQRARIMAHEFYSQWQKQRPLAFNKQSKQVSCVVHINTDDLSGGAAKIARDLAEWQMNQGLTSCLLVHQKRLDVDYSKSIPVNTSRKQHYLTAASDLLQWQDFFHLSSFDLKDDAWIKKADVVHLHNLHGNYFSYLAIPELSAQKHVVWSLHDMHAFTGHCSYSLGCNRWETGCGACPDLSVYPKLVKDTTAFIHETKRRAYQKSNLHIVALSSWLKEKLEKSVLKDQNIHLIYNGIDTSIYKPKDVSDLKDKLGISGFQKVVLFSANLGTANPFKGGQYLTELVSVFEYDISLLFIAVGNSHHIHFTRPNLLSVPYLSAPEDMADYYNLADIYLYPSLADNCPLVALEAMGCGTPVLAFDTGGAAELVVHRETGYIAHYRDSEDLKAGLDWMLQDLERLKVMGITSVERVKKRFTLELMNQQYLTLYQKILKSNSQQA